MSYMVRAITLANTNVSKMLELEEELASAVQEKWRFG
jgi:hypothetical protein